jgi:hypothetical protein
MTSLLLWRFSAAWPSISSRELKNYAMIWSWIKSALAPVQVKEDMTNTHCDFSFIHHPANKLADTYRDLYQGLYCASRSLFPENWWDWKVKSIYGRRQSCFLKCFLTDSKRVRLREHPSLLASRIIMSPPPSEAFISIMTLWSRSRGITRLSCVQIMSYCVSVLPSPSQACDVQALSLHSSVVGNVKMGVSSQLWLSRYIYSRSITLPIRSLPK